MTRDHLLVIDQGTTSTRAVVYDNQLKPIGQSQIEVLPSYPQSGWVEHDPEAIVRSVGSQVSGALRDANVGAERISAVGLTNQRETTIVWERATGRAIAPALVWQDRRTAETCNRLKVHGPEVALRTGLVIDPYFSATKIAWILDHVSSAPPRGGNRAGRGHRRQLFDLASDGRQAVCHRRHQRFPYPPHGPSNRPLGGRPLRIIRCSSAIIAGNSPKHGRVRENVGP